MHKKHKWDFRVHVLFAVAALAAVIGFQPERWLSAEITVGPIEVYKVEYQEKEKLPTSKWTEYEISKALQSATTMRASHYRQLPNAYLLFSFEEAVDVDHVAIPFAVKRIIITLPERRWDAPDMLLQNPNGQWVLYETSHPLMALTRDYR